MRIKAPTWAGVLYSPPCTEPQAGRSPSSCRRASSAIRMAVGSVDHRGAENLLAGASYYHLLALFLLRRASSASKSPVDSIDHEGAGNWLAGATLSHVALYLPVPAKSCSIIVYDEQTSCLIT